MKHFFIKKRGFYIPILFALGLLFLGTNIADNRSRIPQQLLLEIKPDNSVLVDSTTTYKTYSALYDSLQKIEQWKKWKLNGIGDGPHSNFFGITKIEECDSCFEIWPGDSKKENEFKTNYFFELQGYTLAEDASFFIDNGKYFVKYTVWDNKNNNGASGHSEIKETKVRFSSSLEPFSKNETKLLIPISKNTYWFWQLFIWIILFPLLIVLGWVSFIFPIQVLYRIAMGNCFVEKNVRSLRISGWSLIFITLFPIIISLIVNIFLGSMIPKEIYFPFWLYLMDEKGWLIGGICLLLISNAFKQGMRMKQEQDLTV
jgi:hypothetical protein